MNFTILTDKSLDDYTKTVIESPVDKIDKRKKMEVPVDYFQFYKSVSSVYSSRIKGEDIDFDSKCLDFLLMTAKGIDDQD